LGEWIEKPHLVWDWFFDEDPEVFRLYRRKYNKWWQYDRISRRATRVFKLTAILNDLPDRPLARATADIDKHGRAQFEGFAHSIPDTPRPASLRETINSLPDNWPLELSTLPQDLSRLKEALINGTAVGVTDGSYRPFLSTLLGAASWVIECSATKASCDGLVQTSGQRHEVNPYRSELQGLHATLMAVLCLCRFCEITSGSIKIGCDSETGVRLSGRSSLKVSLSTKHVDLICGIRVLISEIPIKVILFDIEGHQDDFTAFEDLPRPAQLNVLMDRRAKDHIETLANRDVQVACPYTIYGEGWRCVIDQVMMTTDPADAIARHIARPAVRKYLHDKGRLDENDFDLVDWQAVGDSMANFPVLFRLWAAKHMCRFCLIGHMMKIWGFWAQDRGCPCCGEDDETTMHLLLCPDDGMQVTWDMNVDVIEDWLTEVDTEPDIIYCIVQALRPRSPQHVFTAYASPSILAAATAQDRIGWINFVEGKISDEWRILQSRYYLELGSRRSGDRWAENLVTKLLELVHSMWTYRNSVLHARDRDGLKVRDGAELAAAINTQFVLGKTGLAHGDRHFISRGHENVSQLPVAERRAWLEGVTLARQTFEADLDNGMESMRECMSSWLRST
jgi:hypothetical protein